MVIRMPRIIKKFSTTGDVPKSHLLCMSGETEDEIRNPSIILESAFISRTAQSS